MHEIEIAAQRPFVLQVVDDKPQIGRDPVRLYRGEVGADDDGAGEPIRDCFGCQTGTSDRELFGRSRSSDLPSIAQLPVPVPRSAIFCGLSPTGEKNSTPLHTADRPESG